MKSTDLVRSWHHNKNAPRALDEIVFHYFSRHVVFLFDFRLKRLKKSGKSKKALQKFLHFKYSLLANPSKSPELLLSKQKNKIGSTLPRVGRPGVELVGNETRPLG